MTKKVYKVKNPAMLMLIAGRGFPLVAVALFISYLSLRGGISEGITTWIFDNHRAIQCFSPLVCMGLWSGGLGLFVLWYSWRIALSPYSVAVCTDGAVLFVRMFRNTAAHVSQIQRIEKVIAWKWIGMGHREIRIRATSGTVPINHFGEAEEFIADLTEINPAIVVLEDENYYD